MSKSHPASNQLCVNREKNPVGPKEGWAAVRLTFAASETFHPEFPLPWRKTAGFLKILDDDIILGLFYAEVRGNMQVFFYSSEFMPALREISLYQRIAGAASPMEPGIPYISGGQCAHFDKMQMIIDSAFCKMKPVLHPGDKLAQKKIAPGRITCLL